MQTNQDSLSLFQNLLPKPEPLLESGDMITILQGLAVVVFIGMLIGLEREYARNKEEKIFAGIRTFPLIGLYGFTSALMSSITENWVYAIFFIGFAGLSIAAYHSSSKDGKVGGTSEVSAFIVFILGSLVYWGYILLPVVIAIIITMFLSLKIQLHSFVGKVSAADIYATLKLAIITLIILPILPDKTYGPFDVLNPRLIWYMVIFVSGISFVGYIFIKMLGKDKGIIVTSLLGGMVSSTALTFSLAKKSKIEEPLSFNYGLGVVTASSMMFLRVLLIISILNVSLVLPLFIPLVIFSLVGVAASIFFYKRNMNLNEAEIELKNPFELKSAFVFGIIFGLTIFLSKAAQVYFGDQGLFAASALAGFSSVDAITISISRLFNQSITLAVAMKAIVFATISNTVIKMFISSFWGSVILRQVVWKGLGIILIAQIIYLIILSVIL
ncbi:MgtC/SapB family protein [Ignavibacterium sp.]|uniref:MgtC/SapB family protein n=1 Tax=Ignavibacterium sp. TaxID=2651167 RepID=UPI00307F29E9